MKYNLQQIIDSFENEENLKYVFFWGHISSKNLITKACFSQWYEAPFTVDSIEYKTTEHWMMAQKAELFGDLEIRDKIVDSVKPGAAKDLGRQVGGFDEKVWNAKKYQIVVTGNYHKFSQNKPLESFLINTKSRVLVEASPLDKIWGVGMAQEHPDIQNPTLWQGENLLGFALMETRDMLIDKV